MEMNNQLLIQFLYRIAYTDGRFDEAEKAFIAEIMEIHNVTVDELLEGDLEIPSEERDRMTILYYVLFLIRIDGDIDERERSVAHKVGLSLGFRGEMISDMLMVMEKYLHERLPEDELVKIIRQYMN